MLSSLQETVLSALVFALLLTSPSDAIRSFPAGVASFAEAPQFRNSDGCPAHPLRGGATACDPSDVHIALTLDSHYLQGSIAAVFSILKHASCPESFFFHFVASAGPSSADLYRTVHSVFPSLLFKIYPFKEKLVRGLISASIREALENPHNYARNYLADLLEPCIERVIYLDSDIIVVNDIRRLWDTRLPEPAVIAAPEYCHANFSPSAERKRFPPPPPPPSGPSQVRAISSCQTSTKPDLQIELINEQRYLPAFQDGDPVAEISMEAVLHTPASFSVSTLAARRQVKGPGKRLGYEENTSLATMQLIYG